MGQHTPMVTAGVGISASAAGAFIAWLIGGWHGGIPPEAAGFIGALLLTVLHIAVVKLGMNGALVPAPSAPAATEKVPTDAQK